jgi:hypothetical protein
VDSTALALFTDMKNADDVKELYNMSIQERTKNMLLLPIGSTMLPPHPTNEVPPEIHEKLILKHNIRLELLSQGSIKGLSRIQVKAKLRVIPNSKFAAAYPIINSISAVELLCMVTKRPGNPTHSISKANKSETIINFDKLERASAKAFISGFKNTTLKKVLLTEDLAKTFPSKNSFVLEPLSIRGQTGPIIPRYQRTT